MLLLFHVELFSFLSAPIESFVVVDNTMETQVGKVVNFATYRQYQWPCVDILFLANLWGR